MKIIDVKTILVQNSPPFVGGSRFLFVQLITDEGIVGLGERPSGQAANLESQVNLIKDLTAQFVIGSNPCGVEKLLQTIYASRPDSRHPGLDSTPALSAIEIASWDSLG